MILVISHICDITNVIYHGLNMISHSDHDIKWDVMYDVEYISSDISPYHMWCHVWHHNMISQMCNIIYKMVWHHMWNHMWYHIHFILLGPARVGLRPLLHCRLQFCYLNAGYWLQWGYFSSQGRPHCAQGGRGRAQQQRKRGLARPRGGPVQSLARLQRCAQAVAVVQQKRDHVLLGFIWDIMPQFTCRIAHIQDRESSHMQTSEGMPVCYQGGSFQVVLKGPCVLTWFGAWE